MSEEFNRERFLQFVGNVRQEILNMQSGEGRWRPGALHFEKDTSPAMHRLELLEGNPTQGNLTQFLELAQQDFGKATADNFKNWSHSIFPVDPIVRKEPVVKPFDVAFKDVVYDLFKGVSIPMSPKQIELLERHALTMARLLDRTVKTEIRAQLKRIVQDARDKKDAG